MNYLPFGMDAVLVAGFLATVAVVLVNRRAR
jgi:hypothetical protein